MFVVPQKVARDRNSAYTHAKVRQAHREWTCRAPGGVAGAPHALLSHSALCFHRASSYVAPMKAPFLRGVSQAHRGRNLHAVFQEGMESDE